MNSYRESHTLPMFSLKTAPIKLSSSSSGGILDWIAGMTVNFRVTSKLGFLLTAVVALFLQICVAHATTTAQDINAALTQVSGASGKDVTNATADDLRRAIIRAITSNPGATTPAATASIAATYVQEVLALRYPIPTTGTAAQIASGTTTAYTNRNANAAMLFTGAIQGMRGKGITDSTAYTSLATGAASAALQPTSGATATQIAATNATRATLAGTIVTQLNTTVVVILSGSSATSLTKDPDVAAAVAPTVASGIIGLYGSADDTRNSAIAAKVLIAIPSVVAVTFLQAERDAAIASVATAVRSSMVNRNEFTARIAKASTTTIQTFAKTIAANLVDNAARVTYASGTAGFFTFPNGTGGANAGGIVLLDTTKALLAAGIAQASPLGEGDIAAAVAGTMSDLNLTSAQLNLAANAIDLRRATVLAGVTKVVPTSAPAITTQYLTALPIFDPSKAPVFAVTVVKSLPVVVNNSNRDDFALTTTAVTGKYVASDVADIDFARKTGITRAVVVAVSTFAEETVKQVALQLSSSTEANYGALSDAAKATLASTFATQVAGNSSGLANVSDATKALIARGAAFAFTGQEGTVAKTIADLPLFSTASPTPTAASRAAIAAAVSKAVPTATQSVAAAIGTSTALNTEATKSAFGSALIALLPATSGVTNSPKLIAAGLASNYSSDAEKISFAKTFTTATATTSAIATIGLITGGVATQLDVGTLATTAPSLASQVATNAGALTKLATIAAEVARVADPSTADEIAVAVATVSLSQPVTDALKTTIANSVIAAQFPAMPSMAQFAAAAAVAGAIANIEIDASKAALTTAVAKVVYADAATVASVATSVSAHVTSTGNTTTAGVTNADVVRQGIASAALKSALPTTVNGTNAAHVNDVAIAIGQGMGPLQSSQASLANIANTLITAVPTYAAQVVGLTTIPGNIASSIAQLSTDPAGVAYAATKASLGQAVNIATAVASRGAGTLGSPLALSDALKAAVAQKVVLAAGTTSVVGVLNAIVPLVTGNQSKADVAHGVVLSAPTQAVLVATTVGPGLDAAGRVLLATGIVTGLTANSTTAGPVAAALANTVTGNTVATKGNIAAAVVLVDPLQVVDIADKVALPASPADKATLAAAITNAIPALNQNSAVVGAAAVAAKVAGQIGVGAGATAQITAIAVAVTGAGGPNTSLNNAGAIAAAVAMKYATTLATAAPTIADGVAHVTGVTYSQQAFIAKLVSTAVPAQASNVLSTVLATSLSLNNVTISQDVIAGAFTTQIPAQYIYIATATTDDLAIYLGANPSSTRRAGDIAVSIATSPGVTTANVPVVATTVATEIYNHLSHFAVGGIADKFAVAANLSGPQVGNGNLNPSNFKTSAPTIATNLATVSYSTAHVYEQMAGIVAGLAEALSIDASSAANITANAGVLASVAKNVATVVYNNSSNVNTASTDIVGYLVGELLARGVDSSVAPGTFLYVLRTALTTNLAVIPVSVVNSIYGIAGASNTATGIAIPNTAYTSIYNQFGPTKGLGQIGEILSTTTLVTPFP